MKGSIALGMEQSEFFTPHTHIQTPPPILRMATFKHYNYKSRYR